MRFLLLWLPDTHKALRAEPRQQGSLRLSLAGGDQEEEEAAGTSMDEPWQQVTTQP